MKASTIKEGDILYHDPSAKWAEGSRFDTTRVQVVDPTPRHWRWDNHTNKYRDVGYRTLIGTCGILVDALPESGSYEDRRRKVVTLNALRGLYEQVAPQVERTRLARGAMLRAQTEESRLRDGRLKSVTGRAAALGVAATGLYPFTVVQIPIAEFEAMVAALFADGWRYEAD